MIDPTTTFLSERSARFRRYANVSARLAGVLLGLGLVAAQSSAQTLDVNRLNQIARTRTAINKVSYQKGLVIAKKLKLAPRWTSPDGTVYVLKGAFGNRPMYISTLGLADAWSTNTPPLWPGGSLGLNLTGLGKKVGIWEAGGNPDINHREIKGRANIRDNNFNVSGHAAHVAGIIGATGLNVNARGMANEASLECYDANNDDAEAAVASTAGVDISNHSYGIVSGWQFGWGGDSKWYWLGDPNVSATKDWFFGSYQDSDATWDDILYNSPYYLPCISSGNSRNPGVPSTAFEHYVRQNGTWTLVTAARDDQSGYDTINFGGQMAKNVLTVGAAEPMANYNGPNSVVISGFSSWGPADDGRIKPEVVGDGVNVFSTFPNDQYGYSSGTSMSSPNVAGSLALLQQHYSIVHPGTRMRSSTLRALVCHTARESGANKGPDYIYGYGMVDTAAAASQITQSAFDPSAIQEVTVNSGTPFTIPVAAGPNGPIRVTIAWTDPGGTGQGAVNDVRTPRLVNDIDLRVRNTTTGVTSLPWTLDPINPSAAAVPGDNIVDNIEQIVIDSPTTAIYDITISNKGSLRPGGRQIVSVIVTAAAPDGFNGLSVDPDVVVGGTQNATATLTLATPTAAAHTVTLSSSNTSAATVPATVTVPAGQDAVSFPVTTKSVRPPAGESFIPVTILAVSDKGARSVSINILPIGIGDFVISPDTVVGGNFVDGVVSLNSPAPKNGASIVLSSERRGIARPIRNWVRIPEGQTSATVRIRTFPVTDATSVIISAERLGSVMEAEITVVRSKLSSITSNPSIVNGVRPIQFTLNLDGFASSGGAPVQLSSDKPDILAVPSVVTIPSGKRSITISATPKAVTEPTTVKITATRLGVTKTTTLTLNP